MKVFILILWIYPIGNIKGNNEEFGVIMYDDQIKGMGAYIYKIAQGPDSDIQMVFDNYCFEFILEKIDFEDVNFRLDFCKEYINSLYDKTRIKYYRYVGLDYWISLQDKNIPTYQGRIDLKLKAESRNKFGEFFSLIDRNRHANSALYYFHHKGGLGPGVDGYLSLYKDTILSGVIHSNNNDDNTSTDDNVQTTTKANDSPKLMSMYRVESANFEALKNITRFVGTSVEIYGETVEGCNIETIGMILNVWDLKDKKDQDENYQVSDDDVVLFPLYTTVDAFNKELCLKNLKNVINKNAPIFNKLCSIPGLIVQYNFDSESHYKVFTEYPTRDVNTLDTLKTKVDEECAKYQDVDRTEKSIEEAIENWKNKCYYMQYFYLYLNYYGNGHSNLKFDQLSYDWKFVQANNYSRLEETTSTSPMPETSPSVSPGGNPDSTGKDGKTKKKSLSIGIIIGIALCSVGVVIGLLVNMSILLKKRKDHKFKLKELEL